MRKLFDYVKAKQGYQLHPLPGICNRYAEPGRMERSNTCKEQVSFKAQNCVTFKSPGKMIVSRLNKAGLKIYFFHVQNLTRPQYLFLRKLLNKHSVCAEKDLTTGNYDFELFTTNYTAIKTLQQDWNIFFENSLLNMQNQLVK